MRVAVFGSNGKVGKLLVEYALAEGHQVTAAVHYKDELVHDANLTVLRGDIYNAEFVDKVVADSDVVLSALSSWHSRERDVLSAAMTNVVAAMKRHHVKRVISLTGSEARAAGDEITLVHKVAHAGASLFAGKILRDGEQHIQLLEASKLDWVVIRSPVMKSGVDQTYRLTVNRSRPWAVINRQAVARAMVNQINNHTNSQKSVFIH